MDWWLWLVLGLFLAALEIFAAGNFFLIFFGAGALVIGVLAGLGAAGPAWLQWLLFSVASIGSLLLFRKPILARLKAGEGPARRVDALEGQSATALEDIPPRGQGRAELRGSAWTAENVGGLSIAKGARCRVDRIDGLRLFVRAEGGDQ